ncbi:MAG: methylglyoxal synthase [Christensenellales bacterium]
MQIALIADDQKKELLNQFCIAYCGILSKQRICATSRTGKSVAEATGLDVECLLPASHGGVQQISSRVSYDEVDIVIFFRDSSIESSTNEIALDLLRLCDIHNVPVATNIASAEVIIRGPSAVISIGASSSTPRAISISAVVLSARWRRQEPQERRISVAASPRDPRKPDFDRL